MRLQRVTARTKALVMTMLLTADDYHVYSPMSSWTNSGIMMFYSGDFGDLRCIQ